MMESRTSIHDETYESSEREAHNSGESFLHEVFDPKDKALTSLLEIIVSHAVPLI